MKKLIGLALILLSLSSVVSAETSGTGTKDQFNLRFWDGTFAYNQLIVSSVEHQSNIVRFELSGSEVNLGAQLEGNPNTWSWKDKVDFYLRKSSCQINIEAPNVRCEEAKTSVNITWTVNQKITKTYDGLVTDLKVVASKGIVHVSFKVPSDENFAPVNEDITVSFFTSFF